MLRPLLACAAALSPLAGADDLPFLHPLFSEHAVLQRDQPLPVWGWSVPGDAVAVSLGGASASAVAGPDGRWQANLPAQPAGGPFVLRVQGGRRAEVPDILLGDVWLCAGQSNMEWNVQNSDGWAAEKAVAPTLAGIRQFRPQRGTSATPRSSTPGTWKNTAAAGQFTAVGYYFARELQQALDPARPVPVGVINCGWGGTTIEAWTSLPGMEGNPRAQALLARRREWDDARLAQARAEWWAQADPDRGQRGAEGVDAEWRQLAVPGAWKDQGVVHEGLVWYRRSVELPAAAAGAAGEISLGIVVGRGTAWINGVEVGGGGGWEDPMRCPIPAGVLREGANLVAVRIRSEHGPGGFFGRPEDLAIAAGGARIGLAGRWRFQTGAAQAELAKLPKDPSQDLAAAIWNAWVEPLTPAALRGVVWYQGETNAWTGSGYDAFLPPLIRDWRARFRRDDLPFAVVQLAGFGKRSAEPVQPDNGQAFVREVQFQAARTIPGVGLVVTIDIGDPDDVHPRNKREVGRRLAAWALDRVYGRSGVVPSGPLFAGLASEGAALRLRFDHAQGLAWRGGPAGFAVAGDDGRWVAAEARIEGTTVVVASPQVARPVQVRYAWAGSPPCPLVNGAGLPASPFRGEVR